MYRQLTLSLGTVWLKIYILFHRYGTLIWFLNIFLHIPVRYHLFYL